VPGEAGSAYHGHVRLAFAAAAACLLGVVGCSLLTSLDGLSGSVEATEAGLDAVAPGDSGGDREAGDSGAASFCATQADARLCEDFDEAPLPGAFDSTAAAGATTTLDSTLSASPQRSLSVTIAPANDTTERFGGVDKVFALGTSLVSLNAKVHLVKVPSVVNEGPRSDLLTLDCGNEPNQQLYSLIVQARPTATGSAEVWLTSFTPVSGAVKYLSPFAAMPVGAWRELRVTTDWAKLTVTLEAIETSGRVVLGTGVVDPPATLALPPKWCDYAVGVYSNVPQDGWSARLDDVVLRTP